MPRFHHLLLTRFNVPHPAYRHDKRGQAVNTPEWLAHRFRLFETYCLPSVRVQTCRNFRWLVFLAADTPEPFRARAEGGCFEAVFVSGEEDLAPAIRARVPADADYLITTRIDNDDAFCRDALETVQAQFREQPFEFVNLATGYILSRGRIYRARIQSSPFVSLIERRQNGPFQTVWCAKHDRLRERGAMCDLGARPYWLQVIHERNLQNDWGEKRGHALQPLKNRLKRLLLKAGVLSPREGWIERTDLTLADLRETFGLRL